MLPMEHVRARMESENHHLDGTKALAEIDHVEAGRFVEDKSAKNINTLHPKTGRPFQSATEWAEKHIYSATKRKISALMNAVATGRGPLPDATKVPPKLEEISNIREFHFAVDSDSAAVRVEVEAQVKKLQNEFKGWKFTASFGGK